MLNCLLAMPFWSLILCAVPLPVQEATGSIISCASRRPANGTTCACILCMTYSSACLVVICSASMASYLPASYMYRWHTMARVASLSARVLFVLPRGLLACLLYNVSLDDHHMTVNCSSWTDHLYTLCVCVYYPSR